MTSALVKMAEKGIVPRSDLDDILE
jgi:hypothetical protein